MMKYFMQASSNITGRKNGANIWITSEQSIFRTKALDFDGEAVAQADKN